MAARAFHATSVPRWRMCGVFAGRVLCAAVCLLFGGARAGLYTESDQVAILTPDNVHELLFNSSNAVLLEFYASWCGHCVAFSPTWKKLALDIKEWRLVVQVAAIDCAEELNRDVCVRFNIRGYPSLRFIPAFSTSDSVGEEIRGFPRDVTDLRHLIIDKLESYKRPPACPPLETTSAREIDRYIESSRTQNQNLALVFEEENSYTGRELILDMLQYVNITVRRVLHSEEELVSRLGVTDFPSVYLYNTHTDFRRLRVTTELRVFYSFALQLLPGVMVREGKPAPVVRDFVTNGTEEQWRPFNKSRVYMSDLESALHYSLRVEVASHSVINGSNLSALRNYISVLNKYFPGRPPVTQALKAVYDWLQDQTLTVINYSDFKLILDQTSPGSFLPGVVRWVGCQGSKRHLRGFPCGMWTLFHTLTVQALKSGDQDPQEVIQAMRQYVRSFFGCRPCADHFEDMAAEDMDTVSSPSAAVLWLWSRHNLVNARLTGQLSEDPQFPKLQWPSPDQCARCRSRKPSGGHAWVRTELLAFITRYYSARRLLNDYLSNTTTPDRRRARAAGPEQDREMMEEALGAPQADRPAQKPSIVGLRLRQVRDDIVDLDSSVAQHHRAKAPLKRRDAEDQVEPRPQSARRTKRHLSAQQAEALAVETEAEPEPYGRSRGARWVLVLSGGFSRLDASLCVTLYLLSALCIAAMCVYFRMKRRQRRTKHVLP